MTVELRFFSLKYILELRRVVSVTDPGDPCYDERSI